MLLQARTFLSLLLYTWLGTATAFACPDANGLLDVNCDGQVKLLTFGDSITFGIADEEGLGYPGRLNQLFPDAIIVNLGRPGEHTSSGRSRASQLFAEHFDADFIVILEGVNDFFDLTPDPDYTKTNLLAMLRSAEFRGAIGLLANLTDVNRTFQSTWVRQVNTAIRSYTNINFFGLGKSILSGDNLHPDNEGYQAMANLLAPILIEISNENRPIDTDADGIYDWAESKFGANPLIADTDGDGINDGLEVFTYHSSPILLDTDGDGFSDYFEISRGGNAISTVPAAPAIEGFELLPR